MPAHFRNSVLNTVVGVKIYFRNDIENDLREEGERCSRLDWLTQNVPGMRARKLKPGQACSLSPAPLGEGWGEGLSGRHADTLMPVLRTRPIINNICNPDLTVGAIT